MESLKVVRSPGWDPGHHEELRNGPEVKIHIWKVVIGVPKKVRVFSVLYWEGSRRFQSGAHLHGVTHMNVGSGESPYNPSLGAPISSLKRNSIISQRDKTRITKRGG